MGISVILYALGGGGNFDKFGGFGGILVILKV